MLSTNISKTKITEEFFKEHFLDKVEVLVSNADLKQLKNDSESSNSLLTLNIKKKMLTATVLQTHSSEYQDFFTANLVRKL